MSGYLPMSCPGCGRERLWASIREDPPGHHFVADVVCDKCDRCWPDRQDSAAPSVLPSPDFLIVGYAIDRGVVAAGSARVTRVNADARYKQHEVDVDLGFGNAKCALAETFDHMNVNAVTASFGMGLGVDYAEAIPRLFACWANDDDRDEAQRARTAVVERFRPEPET